MSKKTISLLSVILGYFLIAGNACPAQDDLDPTSIHQPSRFIDSNDDDGGPIEHAISLIDLQGSLKDEQFLKNAHSGVLVKIARNQHVKPAGGIIPFFRDKSGKVWLLLGEDHHIAGFWNDFGGKISDHGKTESLAEGAAREFREEAMLAFGSPKAKLVAKCAHTYLKRYGMFICEANKKVDVSAFKRFREKNGPALKSDEREKISFAWVPLDEINLIVRDAHNQRNNKISTKVNGKPLYSWLIMRFRKYTGGMDILEDLATYQYTGKIGDKWEKSLAQFPIQIP